MRSESIRYLAMLHALATANHDDATDDDQREHYQNIAGMIEEIVMLEGDTSAFYQELAVADRQIQALKEGCE